MRQCSKRGGHQRAGVRHSHPNPPMTDVQGDIAVIIVLH
jgi:hypothetical protein